MLPRRFPWDAFIDEGRVREVKNYIADGDWVVALFPKLFDLMQRNDIGSGGFDNFLSTVTRGTNVVRLKGGHGAGVSQPSATDQKAIFASMLAFIFAGRHEPVPEAVQGVGPPSWLSYTSRACWLVWIVGLAVLLALGALMLYLTFALEVMILSP